MPNITPEHIKQALALAPFDANAAQAPMAPIRRVIRPENEGIPPYQAGVLLLLYADKSGELHIVLTLRSSTMTSKHRGQISFPGGHRDPEDDSFQATALRETCEELGICEGIRLLGNLSPIYIPPSHFQVYPSVGILHKKPNFVPNPAEVAEVFTLRLADLLDDATKRWETWHLWGSDLVVPFYAVNGHKVWGATAIMLSEFEQRLRVVLAGSCKGGA